MMKNNRMVCFLLIVLISLLTSCNLPGSFALLNDGPLAWIDAPLDGSTIPMVPYEIVAHGGFSGGVTRIELVINNEIVDATLSPASDGQLITTSYLWEPKEPGRYVLQARALTASGESSEYAEAVVFVDDQAEPVADTPAIEVPPTPTPTLADTPTSEPTICMPAVTLTEEANCRQGPNLGYKAITTRKEGVTLPVEGRNFDSTWWWVLLPDQDAHCWISDWIVEAACISDEVPFIPSAPLVSEVNSSVDTFYWGDCDLRKVTIRAEILDESGLTGATIHYRLVKKTGNAASKWLSSPMEQKDGNRWAATIVSHDLPGYADLSEAWLEYYITAENPTGLSTQSDVYKNITLKKCE